VGDLDHTWPSYKKEHKFLFPELVIGLDPLNRPCPDQEPWPPLQVQEKVHIAYQVMGSGPFDLVLVMGFISHLDLDHENPWIVWFLERLSSFCRLILFDKRGTGLSDRVSAMPTLE
jgi:hypothetical protein